MKSLLLSSTLAAFANGAVPTFGAEFGGSDYVAGAQALDGLGNDDGIFEHRGRGRGGDDDHSGGGDDDRDEEDRDGHGGGGRGGDDNRDDDRDDDNGRDPRVPGGSGCDDPGDLLEHPECSPGPLSQ